MKKKIGLVVAIIFIGALAFGISRVVQNPEQYQKTDPNIEAIMNSCEVTEAQAKPFGVSFRNVVLAVLKLFPVTLCLMDFITRMILDIGLEQKMGIILYFI